MAGTTQLIHRAWSKVTSSASNVYIDAVKAFFDNLNLLVADLETVRAGAPTTLLNQLRTARLYSALGNPAFAIKTNFDVQNANAIAYTNNGTLKTLAAAQVFDTGTTQVIATSGKWSAALLSISSSGGAVLTWSTTLNAATEAAAIAALPAIPDATSTVLGYVTVQSDAAATWTAGTDALTGGTGGTPAQATNYYNNINPNGAFIGVAAVNTSAGSLTAFAMTEDDVS